MNFHKTNFTVAWAICLLLIVLNYCLLFLPIDNLMALTREDALVENASALFLLAGSVAFFIAYFWSQNVRLYPDVDSKPKRNIFFLLLALFLFVAFGEEISWAQRIFKVETPELLKGLNYQQEINLHNLEIFEGKNPDGSQKGGFAALFTSHRLFYMMIIGWTFLVPLAYRFLPALRNLLKRIRFPVHPLRIGILIVSVLIIARIIKIVTHLPSEDFDHAVTEIGELNFAVVIAYTGLYWVWMLNQNKSGDRIEIPNVS